MRVEQIYYDIEKIIDVYIKTVMAFPICDKCAATGVLCAECEKKAREGSISELEILVSSILMGHGAYGYDSLKELENKLIIFASGEDTSKIIGTRGNAVTDLSKKIGRRVVVIDKSWDKDLIIRSLARPVRLMTKNRVYREGGKEIERLIFDKPLDKETVELMTELIGDIEVSCNKGT